MAVYFLKANRRPSLQLAMTEAYVMSGVTYIITGLAVHYLCCRHHLTKEVMILTIFTGPAHPQRKGIIGFYQTCTEGTVGRRDS